MLTPSDRQVVSRIVNRAIQDRYIQSDEELEIFREWLEDILK